MIWEVDFAWWAWGLLTVPDGEFADLSLDGARIAATSAAADFLFQDLVEDGVMKRFAVAIIYLTNTPPDSILGIREIAHVHTFRTILSR